MISLIRWVSRERVATIVAGCVFLSVLVWLVPIQVAPRSDDFAYYESVAKSIRVGRLVQSDWLAPLNVSLTSLSAAFFWITGSFVLSTNGINVALAFAGFFLLRRWIQPAGHGAIIALALVLFPVALNKAVEFTGVPLTVVCTLAALIGWKKRQWYWFYAAVLIGVLNRQSAIFLMSLPAVEILLDWKSTRRVPIKGIAVWALVIGAILVLLQLVPPNWAREVVARDASSLFRTTTVANLALAVVVLVAWRAVVFLLYGGSLRLVWRENLAKPMLPAMVSAIGAVLVFTRAAEIRFETPGFYPYSVALLAGSTFFAAWLHPWRKPVPVACAAYLVAFMVFVSWRAFWWDYYFLEPALVVLGTVRVPAGTRVPFPSAAILLLVISVSFIPSLKSRLGEIEAKVVTYEQALRDGRLAAHELSDAPFGFLAWKVFPALGLEPGDKQFTDFLKFVEGGRVFFNEGDFIVLRDGGRKSIHPSREYRPLPDGYEPPPLPLSDAEWRGMLVGTNSP